MVDKPDPSIGELMHDLIDNVQTLFHEEIELARTEIRGELDDAKQVGLSLATAGALLGAGALLPVLALAEGIAALFRWPTWVGYGVTGLLLAAVGAVRLAAARQQLRRLNLVPDQTVTTMKENIAWMKAQAQTDSDQHDK